jgi:hypothetical protein
MNEALRLQTAEPVTAVTAWRQDRWTLPSDHAAQAVSDWFPRGEQSVACVCSPLQRGTQRLVIESNYACGSACLAPMVRRAVANALHVPTRPSPRWSELPRAFHADAERVSLPQALAALVPQAIRENLRILPLRVDLCGVLQLAASAPLEPVVLAALSHMTGFVARTVALSSEDWIAGSTSLNEFPASDCLEVPIHGTAVIADMLTSAILQTQPAATRMARMRDHLWVRMEIKRAQPDVASPDCAIDLLYRIGTVRQ